MIHLAFDTYLILINLCLAYILFKQALRGMLKGSAGKEKAMVLIVVLWLLWIITALPINYQLYIDHIYTEMGRFMHGLTLGRKCILIAVNTLWVLHSAGHEFKWLERKKR